MNYILHILIIFTLLSCKHEKEIGIILSTNHIKKDTLLNRELICVLKDNVEVIGDIKSIAIAGDNRFVVSTSKPANVMVHDFNGNQITKIGSEGKGPYQYLQPSIVRYFNNQLFIWCAINLRLIVYDIHGNPQYELNNFGRSIDDFTVDQNKIFVKMDGGFRGKVLEKLDVKTGSLISNYGEYSKEDIVMGLLGKSGGLTQFNNQVLFMQPSKLALNFIDKHTDSLKPVDIEDPDFKVDQIHGNPINYINNNRTSALNYIYHNSVVTKLVASQNEIVIFTENGHFKFKDQQIDNEERFVKIYILNRDLQLKKIVKKHHSFHDANYLYDSYDGKIYNIHSDIKDDDLKYTLSEVLFN